MEVEAALAQLDEVRIAYVVGVPDPDKGAIVCAAVVLNEGNSISGDELVTACRRQLAAYKIPKKWVILSDAHQLPYTTTDKIDKKKLASLLAEGTLR
jgi:acyl-coenzyme A synthetase/AMP-(fatty) acid ligase